MFSQALTHIVTRLDQAQRARLLASYALIGGFAVSAWGVARATQDIDLAVALGTSNPQSLAGDLGAIYEAGGLDDPLRGVFRLSLRSDGHDFPAHTGTLIPRRTTDLHDMEDGNISSHVTTFVKPWTCQ